MGTISRIALRNLNRQKKRSFLLGGAIAFGIFVVTLISGFAGAFQRNLAANMAQMLAGHVFIEGVEKTSKDKPFQIIRDDALLTKALEDSGIRYESVSRRSYTSGYLVFAGKRAQQSVYGIDFAKEPLLKERIPLKAGSWERISEPGSLILNEGISKKLKLQIGDKLVFQLRSVTGQNNFGDFTVVGISQDMGMFSSMIAYTDQTYLNGLLDIGPEDYELFSVMIKNMGKADADTELLLKSLKDKAPVFELTAEDLKSLSASTSAMQSRYTKLQKQAKDTTWTGAKYRVYSINDTISFIEDVVSVINFVSAIILLVLFLIIMVGINNTFRMIMFERIREIGTMRACGMQRGAVKRLFLTESLFMAIGGTVAGWIAAGAFMGILSLFNFGTASVLSLFLKNGHFSFLPQPLTMLAHFALVLALTLAAAYLPARKASLLSPAEALRSSK
jgi:ABC-type transport system, involved in lipoprotein release, permease component